MAERPDRLAPPSDRSARRARGFLRAGGLIGSELKAAVRKHGFSEVRLLTHWAEIAGPDIAAIARPVKMRRGPGGGTLTLLVEGARAPEMQMRLPSLRARLAAALGPMAVQRIAITQTSGRGFAEAAAPYAPPVPQPLPAGALDAVRPTLDGVADGDLRAALETLAENVLSRARSVRKPGT